MCVEATGQKFVGKESCLWEVVRPFFYANIYPTIKDFLSEAVFAYDFFRKNVVFKVHVFRMFHGCVEVKILDVYGEERCIRCDITELKRSLAVVRSVVGVVTSHG